jgi:hypothetical protein
MTADEFRAMALGLPATCEMAHMNHPDFRVRGKIFATLAERDESWGMVKLTPEDQQRFIKAEPDVFTPVKGAWGRQGCTTVHLPSATEEKLRPALVAAWRNVATAALAKKYPDRD